MMQQTIAKASGAKPVAALSSRPSLSFGCPPILQRKCACGGSAGPTGECAECRNKKLQRKTRDSEAFTQPSVLDGRPSEVPPSVHEQLRSPGQPLDAATRSFMEPRFGHDFSRVRVHADQGAHSAAQAVQARACTFGSNILFAASEYAPATTAGKELLAHELTHVVQQSNNISFGTANQIGSANDSAEGEANRMAQWVVSSNAPAASAQVSHQTSGVVSRQPAPNPPSQVNCPAGVNGAPANAEALLNALETTAILATTAASMDLSMLQLDAKLPGLGAGGGLTMPTGPRLTNYQNRWGLPPAAGGGRFRNRLSGATFPTRAEALVEEASSLQDRYSRIADFLAGTTIRFRCINGQVNVGSCQADCSIRPAFGCPTVILLCPGFWNIPFRGQSQLLIHEVAHTIFGILHNHNFTHADCYAAYAADATGTASGTIPACVP